MRLEDLVNQKQIGQEGTEVDGGVQVVHQLRADRGLREHQSNGRHGVARIAIDHVHERRIRCRGFNVQPFDEFGDELGQTGERPFTFREELTDLAARAA